jgi:hypothetical protein
VSSSLLASVQAKNLEVSIMTREDKKQRDGHIDVYELKEPLKERFTEEARETEPLEPPELPDAVKEVELDAVNERRGHECVCPQCGKELSARTGADCSLEFCPECGLALHPR